MNLYLFPTLPGENNGYRIAVARDMVRCDIQDEDWVIFYDDKVDDVSQVNHHYIRRPRMLSIKRIVNVLSGRMSVDVRCHDVFNLIKHNSFDKVVCGDVIFYIAIRQLFPQQKLEVRFHNCFARIQDRVNAMKIPIHVLRYKMNMRALYRLETMIFRDNNCVKHFITQEDMSYYQMVTGRKSDCDVWGILPDSSGNKKVVHYGSIDKIVWFGGVQTHKMDSVRWFALQVFPKLKNRFPELEFHLWGRGTSAFNEPHLSIYGHGYYEREAFPYVETALYVNPDLMGGGVKVKLCTYFDSGVRFITSPFGFEGYDETLIDNKQCFVVEESSWVDEITKIIVSSKLI